MKHQNSIDTGIRKRLETDLALSPRNARITRESILAQQRSHATSKESVEWYTPKWILEIARDVLGSFGGNIWLDPASSRKAQKAVNATFWYGLDHPDKSRRDGLAQPWDGNVFLNPPYCGNTAKWVEYAYDQYINGQVRNVFLVVKSVPGYVWWEDLLDHKAHVSFMLRERVEFISPTRPENKAPARQGTTLALFSVDGRVIRRFRDCVKPYGGRFIE